MNWVKKESACQHLYILPLHLSCRFPWIFSDLYCLICGMDVELLRKDDLFAHSHVSKRGSGLLHRHGGDADAGSESDHD